MNPQPAPLLNLTEENLKLESQTAEQRVAWGLAQFPGAIILSSSFGAQAAVCLHLVTVQAPQIPVVLIDTGYLFPETYRFIDELRAKLDLNLKIYQPAITSAYLEARHGKLWEQGIEGITRYNQIVKVEPMQRALIELNAQAWIAGLRRQQASTREQLGVLGAQGERVKIHPIIDWTDRDVYQYLTKYDLPYHPLWHEGYASIGDWHSTSKLGEGMTEEETRFGGLKRECGLHETAKS
jgi:phosphoadenosine phosphosulfate reductase